MDTASTPPATQLLHRAAHTLPAPDKGIRCHLVGTSLRVATLNLAGIRRRTVRTLRVQAPILPADTPISRSTHRLVILVTVHRWLVMSINSSLY